MVGNGWLSDRKKEVRWHTAVAAIGLLLTALFLRQSNVAGVVASLGTMGSIPVYWQVPSRFLSATALVVGLAVINSVANLAGYFSPQLLGLLQTRSGSYAPGLLIIVAVEFCAAILVLLFVGRGSQAAR